MEGGACGGVEPVEGWSLVWRVEPMEGGACGGWSLWRVEPVEGGVGPFTTTFACLQFFPEFEKECQEVMGSRGLTFPRGFSARELFQKMAAIELIPEMIGAVKSIKAAGKLYCCMPY